MTKHVSAQRSLYDMSLPIRLSLSDDAAQALASLTGHVTGEPFGRAGLIQEIRTALSSAGLDTHRRGPRYGMSGIVRFDRYDPAASNSAGTDNTRYPDVANVQTTPTVSKTQQASRLRTEAVKACFSTWVPLPVNPQAAKTTVSKLLTIARDANAITQDEWRRWYDMYSASLDRRMALQATLQKGVQERAAELAIYQKRRSEHLAQVNNLWDKKFITPQGRAELWREFDVAHPHPSLSSGSMTQASSGQAGIAQDPPTQGATSGRYPQGR